MELDALDQVVQALPAGQFSIGLMLFSESGGANGNPSGGYVRSAIRLMDAASRDALATLVRSLDEGLDKGNAAEYALAMHEASLYFAGETARAGHNKVKHDPAAFNPNPTYQKPTTEACVPNYVIFISNGSPDKGENSKAADLLAGAGGRLPGDPISLQPSGQQANWSDEYARMMAGQGIHTYTIDVGPLTTGQGPDNTALLKSMANQGEGRYYAVYSKDDLVDALNNILIEVHAVDSVYAATALPVSVNVRGTYLNEVYMAVFRPSHSTHPRWLGNLKLYQLAVSSTDDTLYLADTAGDPAQSPVSGFIRSSARSYWTHGSDYWGWLDPADPDHRDQWPWLSSAGLGYPSDDPDGEIVEKGGSRQHHREDPLGWTNRPLYTCTGDCPTSGVLTEFRASSNPQVTKELLGVADEDARTALMRWVRGQDNLSPRERDTVDGLSRPSLHGDVVHSRPAVVNYNSTGDDDDIVVFYGANDGVFRAIRGGKAALDGGRELWGFVAPELFGGLKRLRDNAPLIDYPAVPGNPGGRNKPYFVDGSASVYVKDADGDGRIRHADGDKAYVYVTMRRGGRFLYAFDVSDPLSPRFLWKRGHGDAGYSELGETWSEAKVARLELGDPPVPRTVIIMGAGYDAVANDTLPVGDDLPASRATMGRGILVADALTGELIWQAGPSPAGAPVNLTVPGMFFSVAADTTVLDRDRNGFADRIYAADTGGNIWRVDIGSSNPARWAIHKLAALGGTGTDGRKFLFAPDVVYAKDAAGVAYDAVLIGSGDREKPTPRAASPTVANHFFMLRDRRTGLDGGGQATILPSDLYDATANLVQVGTDIQVEEASEALAAGKGWFIRLGTEEKGVGSAVTIGGAAFFATHQPKAADPQSCGTNLGTARIYVLDFKTGAAAGNLDGSGEIETVDRFIDVPGGGYLPSPTPVIVEMPPGEAGPDAKKYQTVCFGPNCIEPPGVELESRRRVWWYRTIE